MDEEEKQKYIRMNKELGQMNIDDMWYIGSNVNK